jgi:hypothetical protein
MAPLALVLLIIIGSFLVFEPPPKVMVQASSPQSEGAKLLVDDVIQDLKSNDTKKAQVHLDILTPNFLHIHSCANSKLLLSYVKF